MCHGCCVFDEFKGHRYSCVDTEGHSGERFLDMARHLGESASMEGTGVPKTVLWNRATVLILVSGVAHLLPI